LDINENEDSFMSDHEKSVVDIL